MLPGYGCGIHDLVFEPDNPGTIAEVVSNASARHSCVTSRGSTCSRSTWPPRPASRTCC